MSQKKKSSPEKKEEEKTKNVKKLFPLELSPEKWDTQLLEAIAMLKASEFILPHQVPLYPRKKSNYETYLIYIRIMGLKKTLENVNSALSSLIVFPQKTLLNVPEDLRTICHQLNIWIDGLPGLLRDFNRGDLSKNIEEAIEKVSQSARKWKDIIYPAWYFKFA